jgi:hypothetical protein
LELIPKYRDIGYPRYGESWLSGITNMVKTPAIYRLSPIYQLGKKKSSAEHAQEDAHCGWQAEGRFGSCCNTGSSEEDMPALDAADAIREGVGLHACQKSSGVRENMLMQDVKTRCRSTHAMTDSLRVNQEPLLVYEVRNAKLADGFNNNRLSLEDWSINNQSVSLLTPLANASQYLEGKNYPTSNLVIPSMYGCIELLHPDAAVRQPWDCKLLQPKDLRSEVTDGR